MLNAAEQLRAELGDEQPNKAEPNGKAKRNTDDVSVFGLANGVDTFKVLDRIGVAHDGEKFAQCPGCKEPKAKVGENGGLKCLHNRCSDAGPPGFDGFRTNTDLVALVENVEALEAAKRICDWFGIDVPKAKSNGANGAIPPDDYVHNDQDAPNAPPKSNAQHIRIMDADAIFAPLEEPDWLIDGVIRRGSITEFMAYGGSAKTWGAVEATISVAAGVPWLGRFETKRGSVLFLDYESGSYEMRRRHQAVARARGVPIPVQGVALASMPALYMSDPKFGDEIRRLAEGRDLIVIDTLKAANPGTDENSSEMRAGLDRMRPAAEETGCAFLVLLHSRKKPPGLTLDALDGREMGRGSSAIYDAADSVFWLVYEKDKPQRVYHTKARLGRMVDPFEVCVADTENGGVLVSASDLTEEKSTNDGFGDLCTAVLEIVRANPGCSGRLIRAKAGVKTASALAALEELERHGAVRNTGTSRAAQWCPTDTPQRDWNEVDDD